MTAAVRCPGCHAHMTPETRSGITVDRSAGRRGLFVEANELIRLEKEGIPEEVTAFESRFADAMIGAGPTVLHAAFRLTVIRLLLRV